MASPQGTFEWLALIGAVGGGLSLILLIWCAVLLHRTRRAQKIVLGGERRDVVAHAEALQREFVSLRDWLEDVSAVLDRRMLRLEEGLENSVSHTAMIRYDAFGAKSGKQSSSVALLDEHRTGVVLTAIVARNFSHLYVKQLEAGVSEIELSPEERHVVELAFAREGQPPAPPTPPAPTRIVTDSAARPPEPPGTPDVRPGETPRTREAHVER